MVNSDACPRPTTGGPPPSAVVYALGVSTAALLDLTTLETADAEEILHWLVLGAEWEPAAALATAMGEPLRVALVEGCIAARQNKAAAKFAAKFALAHAFPQFAPARAPPRSARAAASKDSCEVFAMPAAVEIIDVNTAEALRRCIRELGAAATAAK